MRKDQQGFFWEDQERVSVWANKHKGISSSGLDRGGNRPLPSIPETGWKAPTEFPNLDNAKILSIDTETYDPNLLTSGPSIRTGGHLCGISVATHDASWYFPMRHTIGENMEPEKVIAWAKHTFALPMDKVFHNAMYDLEWLESEGIKCGGFIYDTMYAEPLLDEESRHGYSLNNLAGKYLGQQKETSLLYDWSSRAYGGPPDGKQRKNISRCPVSLVGPYAEQDAVLPLHILEKQIALLKEQKLYELFRLECRLLPVLLYMRRLGVRVDVPAAERAHAWLSSKIEEATKRVNGINVNAGADIAYFCDKNGIEYPRTEKGAPSFTQNWLENHTDPRINAITDLRRYTKARDTFVQGYILDKHVNGRLYCQFHPLKGDDNGTVSGRFSSALPNLQNIPARDKEIGPLIRSLFIPEEGSQWLRFDWSQIEYRLLAHYAMGEGAEEARERYKNDPNTDFHTMTQEIVWPGQPEMRKQAKNINFGLVYGMAERTMAANLGRPLEEVQPMFNTYHSEVPFVRETYNKVANRAGSRGFITTVLGRRRRFDLWESTKYGEGIALPEAEAREKYKRVRRAYTHKALNSLLQGGSADLMKLALVMIWEAGLLDENFVLHLLVHDEFDFSMNEADRVKARQVHEIMQTCIELRVPIVAEVELGANWGNLESYVP
jgi:DNA polymerase I-like protein with 3'-5' exonuclease and polymerase domains